jgi:hypothetical protein
VLVSLLSFLLSYITNALIACHAVPLLRLLKPLLQHPQSCLHVVLLQMWNSLFWPCMAALGKCADNRTDDIGLITHLIDSMQSTLLPGIRLQPKVQLSGYSNGGMLVQAMLCRQPSIVNKLAGIVILASTLGSIFAGSKCTQKFERQVPLLWVHGQADNTLPFAGGTSEGVQVMGPGGFAPSVCVPLMSILVSLTTCGAACDSPVSALLLKSVFARVAD